MTMLFLCNGNVEHLIFPLLFLCTVTGQVRYSIPEEMTKGSVVGDIASDLGIAMKRLKDGRARIITGDNSRCVDFDTDKGILVVNERIDRELLCKHLSPCSLSFEVILENPIQLYSVTLEINDVNDHAPTFQNNNKNIEISEMALPGARFLLDSAFDPDVGVNGIQSYILRPTDNFALKVETHPDGSKYVEIVLQTPLDREREEEHSLVLTAVDGGRSQKTGTMDINVVVLDANDNSPVFSQKMYIADLMENSPKGTTVTTVSADDIDAGSNSEVTYSFSHVMDNYVNLFHIDEKSGVISALGQFDFESIQVYTMTVTAKDGGGLTDSCKVRIQIVDANDNAPVISLTSLYNPVSENAPSGTTIAVINVKDLDSGENGRVKCSINKTPLFTIQSSLTNYYTLLTVGLLDRETDSVYNITITATDEGSPPLATNKTLSLKVSDINDNPPIFEQKSYSASLFENNSPGLSVLSVKAKDADCCHNARVSYLLEDSEVNGLPASSLISVDAESGAISALRSFDYEHIREIKIHIRAQDGGSPPLSGNVTVLILVLDQNDNAPQVLYPVATGGPLVAEIVPRSVDIGYLVTKVVAVDGDSGQNAWLSYKLVKTTDRPLFEIGLQNGEIRTIRQVTDKDAVKQRLTVVVEDNGQPPRSATVNVNVAVADSFPEVLSEYSDFTHDKDYNDNLTFYLVLALAVVSFLFILSLVVIVSVKMYRWRQSRLFYSSNLPVIPYYPPMYADVGCTGTLQHTSNFDGTTDSRTSDMKYFRPISQGFLSATHSMAREQVRQSPEDTTNSSDEVSVVLYVHQATYSDSSSFF